MSDAALPVSLPGFKGSIVCVSNLIAPPTIIVQSPRPGYATLDIPTYSFLVENEMAGENVLFELGPAGMMKAWKEMLPDCTSPSHRP